jgi:hypothetical protein
VTDQLFGESERDYFFETGYLPGQVHGVNDPVEQTVFTRLETLDTLRDRQAEERLETLIYHPPGSVMRREHAADVGPLRLPRRDARGGSKRSLE